MSTGTTTSTGVMDEQAKYWMWMKRKIMMSHKPAAGYVHDHYNYSTTTSTFKQDLDVETSNWEEQAFVEDSVGPLGGFIWPPRSYSCSFCGREFRSAQALGGHMNVHRRDRAKLKGSPSPTSSSASPPKNESCLQLHKRPYSSSSNDKNSNPSFVSISQPLSTPKICEETSTTLGSSLHRRFVSTSTTVSSQSKLKNSSKPAHEIAGFEAKEDNIVKPADSSVMNLYPNRRTGLGNKKRRQDHVSSLLPLSLKTCSMVDQCRHFHNKVPGLIPSSMEELDLELRLGDRPKR